MRKRLVVMGGLALFFVLSADACLLWAQERVQDRRQLTITFTDGTKQTVTLRQDAGNIVSLEYTGGAPAGGGGSAGGAGSGVPLLTGKTVSLRSFNYPTHYLRHRGFLGELTAVSSSPDRSDATFRIVAGLGDRNMVSFESVNHPRYFLRHQGGRLKLHSFSDDDLFRKDATYRVRHGLANPAMVSFESQNYPGYFIRHRNSNFWVEYGTDDLFRKDATFEVVEPLAR